MARYESRDTAASIDQNEGDPVGGGRVRDHSSHYLQNMLCRNVANGYVLISVPVSLSEITS